MLASNWLPNENRRVSSFRRAIAGVCLLSAVSACQYDPYTSEYATTKPDPSLLVGTWRPTPETRKKLDEGPYTRLDPRIQITAGGEIQMLDVPDTWRSLSGEGTGKADSFAGQWELSRHQDEWWQLSLSRKDWGCYGCLMILRNAPPYRLVLRYGDPDLGWGYEFDKVSDAR